MTRVLFRGICNLRSAEAAGSPARVTVVLNWFEELRTKAKVADPR